MSWIDKVERKLMRSIGMGPDLDWTVLWPTELRKLIAAARWADAAVALADDFSWDNLNLQRLIADEKAAGAAYRAVRDK